MTPAAARTRARVLAMQDAQRHLFHRQIVPVPVTERPLFLAPHPDDIALGCGGTLHKLLARGVPMRLAYLTDGRAAATDPAQQPAMAVTRAREARAVSNRLGLPEPHLFAWDENTFGDPAQLAPRSRALADLIVEWNADAVFVPYLFDQHPHHRLANHLLAGAMRAAQRHPRVYGYEVWSVPPPGVVVDISGELEKKKELVSCYASQLALFPYLEMVDVQARTHASLIGGQCTAAETFCPFDGRAFCRVVADLDLTSPETTNNEVLTIPPDTW